MTAWCDDCDRWFPHDRAFKQHLQNSSAHHYCLRCQRNFASPYALAQHQRNSSNHNICGRCGQDFVSQDDLDEHIEDRHWYCGKCEVFVNSKADLEAHYVQSNSHHYCAPCERHFVNENALDHHLRSARHTGRTIQCPGCNRAFPTISAMTIHLEAGTCRSGATRETVDSHVRSLDSNNHITRPLLTYPGATESAETWATRAAWNGSAYECYFCNRDFRQLQHLNQHLHSPVHRQKMYYCPKCQADFKVFSGLIQHVESESCGISRFRETRTLMNGITQSLTRRLAYPV